MDALSIFKNLLNTAVPATRLLDVPVVKNKVVNPVVNRLKSNVSDPNVVKNNIITPFNKMMDTTSKKVLEPYIGGSFATSLGQVLEPLAIKAMYDNPESTRKFTGKENTLADYKPLYTKNTAKEQFEDIGRAGIKSALQAKGIASPVMSAMVGGLNTTFSGALSGREDWLKAGLENTLSKSGRLQESAGLYSMSNPYSMKALQALKVSGIAKLLGIGATNMGESALLARVNKEKYSPFSIQGAIDMAAPFAFAGAGAIGKSIGKRIQDSLPAPKLTQQQVLQQLQELANAPKKQALQEKIKSGWGKEADILNAGNGIWAGKGAMKQQFDNALYGGDIATIKKLLPDIPQEYTAIDTVAAKLTKLLGEEAFAPADVMKSQKGILNLGADVSLPTKKLPFDLERWKAISKGATGTGSRPSHQVLLEEAARAGDIPQIRQLLDSIPEGDPYKATMEHIFRPRTLVQPDTSQIQRVLADQSGGINFGSKVSVGRDIAEEQAAKRAKALGGFEPAPLEAPVNLKTKEMGALQDVTDLGIKKETPDYITNQQPSLFKQGEGYNATPTKQTAEAIFEKGQEAERVALKRELDVEDSIHMQEVKRELNDNLEGIADSIKNNTGLTATKDASKLNDVGALYDNANYIRTFRHIFGKAGEAWDNVNDVVLRPFRAAKGQYADDVFASRKSIYDTFVSGWGIKRGSKESAILQNYGERVISLDDLKKLRPADWNNYVEGDKIARTIYNDWRSKVNAVRAVMYPNQPEKLIPFRQDYYRHFQDFEQGYAGIRNIMESAPGIPSEMAGVTDFAKPKSKFLSIALPRLGGKYKVDAVGGMLDYVNAAAYAKNIDPQIPKFRALAKELVDKTAEGLPTARRLNGAIDWINDFANDLAGKTNPIDRGVSKVVGRKTLRVMNFFNNRIKKNLIVGNASSAISQFFNLPNGIADAGKVNSAEGFTKYAKQLLTGIDADDPILKSNFMKERYLSQSLDKFDTGILSNLSKFGKWMQRVGDKAVAQTIFNAEYIKATKANIPNPIDYASQQTELMIAGRGIGEVPMVQKAISTQLIAPFQVEVNNEWWVMKDMVQKDEKGKRQLGNLMTLLVVSHIMNKAAEKIKGSAVVFDPIQATVDAVRTKQPLRIAGEVMGNMPFGQTAASLIPEYGFAGIPGTSRKALFGRQDPTRFGTGMLIGKGIEDPVFKLLAPFGGAQVKKSIEGVKSFSQGQVTDSKGKKVFDVERNLPNFLRSILYGQYSTPEAVQYYKGKDVPAGSTPKKNTSSYGSGSSYNKGSSYGK